MTQVIEAPKLSHWSTLLLIALLVAVLLLTGGTLWWYWDGAQTLDRETWQAYRTRLLLCWAVLFAVALLVWLIVHKGVRRWIQINSAMPSSSSAGDANQPPAWEKLRRHLHNTYGYFWRRQVRLLLVVGEPDEIKVLASSLAEQHWLDGQGTILLWGGSLMGEWECDWPNRLRDLSKQRPLDGVVWALSSTQRDDGASLRIGVDRLQELARNVRWQIPLYLWQVGHSNWPQAGRDSQSVGCLLQPGASIAQIESALHQLVAPLREQGLAQLAAAPAHDYLLRLSRDLRDSGIARWRDTLAPLLPSFSRGVPLRGLLFSLESVAPPAAALNHSWWPEKTWDVVREDRQTRGRPVGWRRGVQYGAMGVVLFCSLALLLAFASSRSQIADVQLAATQLRESRDLDSQLTALYALTRELSRLEYQRQHGVARYLQLGLSQNDALLTSLWPLYAQANHRLMRDAAVASLEQQLAEFSQLPPGNSERAERALAAREQLKAYLMMAEPQRTEAAALANELSAVQAERHGVSPGLWRDLAPKLWLFYAEHLPDHPEWRIKPQLRVVTQARQVLLRQLGQRNGVANLYQELLAKASNQYADLHLSDMVGETDATSLFNSSKSVPGVFTRQAWEGYVRDAIDEIAEARRDEIDWVLSDSQQGVAGQLQTDELKTQLTERYFQDYGRAWLAFLNSVRWYRARNLSESIDQLTLLSDVRQSPLIALMNTLAYQGRSNTQGLALADSLVKSATKLIEQDKQPVIDQSINVPRGPLDGTFGPLLSLLGQQDAQDQDNVDEQLSLQAFLTRVTRVRLKLQQVASAPNPQAMTQALAQTVFRGTGVDLTDTLDYGGLIAASLGAEWSGFGQNLFVEPLNRAWTNVLQPSTASLNRRWQLAIVDSWNRDFTGRYPFSASGSDASLPMLGQMIRSDSGRIEQFLQRELAGVLYKEGKRWVVDATNAHGLRFSPEFLNAMNLLSELADILYTDGGMGMTFALQAKPVRDVVRTTLVIDGVALEYFNQMESWQQFRWPSTNDHPGTSLTWTHAQSGARLFGDYQGTWGLLRLLEQAQATPLDDQSMQVKLVLNAPDGLPLTWHLRAELATGPLALLRLRGFALPENIFEVGAKGSVSSAVPLASDKVW